MSYCKNCPLGHYHMAACLPHLFIRTGSYSKERTFNNSHLVTLDFLLAKLLKDIEVTVVQRKLLFMELVVQQRYFVVSQVQVCLARAGHGE